MLTNDDFFSKEILKNCLTNAQIPELPNYVYGKVRESYSLPDGHRIMIATDRQSAFDSVLASVPYKGQVLNEISKFWFEKTINICANHVLEFPDPNVIITKNLEMLPIEVIVRDYMTGSTETSIWPMYEQGNRNMYGHDFPDGLVKNQKLPSTIITPTTKAAQGDHDAPITAREILDTKLLSEKLWCEVCQKAYDLFALGREVARKNGLILVDTKYEFGLDNNGVLTIADEIHTPDSSRYWIESSYQSRINNGKEPESLDKEFLRLWIVSQCDPYQETIPKIPEETLLTFSKKYVSLFEQVTGLAFQPPKSHISIYDRIHKNLSKRFPEFF